MLPTLLCVALLGTDDVPEKVQRYIDAMESQRATLVAAMAQGNPKNKKYGREIQQGADFVPSIDLGSKIRKGDIGDFGNHKTGTVLEIVDGQHVAIDFFYFRQAWKAASQEERYPTPLSQASWQSWK